MMQKHQPALLGGLFIGVLSALPVVGAANMCCCLWVVAGGVLTTYLLQQNQAEAVGAADAAVEGLLAGAIGAGVYLVVTTLLLGGLGTGPEVEQQVRDAFDQNPQIPPEVRNMVLNALAGRNLLLMIAAVTLPMYAVFSMLGALLGRAVFGRKTPAAPGGVNVKD